MNGAFETSYATWRRIMISLLFSPSSFGTDDNPRVNTTAHDEYLPPGNQTGQGLFYTENVPGHLCCAVSGQFPPSSISVAVGTLNLTESLVFVQTARIVGGGPRDETDTIHHRQVEPSFPGQSRGRRPHGPMYNHESRRSFESVSGQTHRQLWVSFSQ